MQVVTEILGRLDDAKRPYKEIDEIFLSSEQRSSPHMVCYSSGGRTVKVSLARGTELNEGDILGNDDGIAIVVSCAREDLFVITPRGAPVDWSAIGYQLGNLHRPVRFAEDALLTPKDAMVADLLDRMGVCYSEEKRSFIGKRYGSFTGHHHDEY